VPTRAAPTPLRVLTKALSDPEVKRSVGGTRAASNNIVMIRRSRMGRQQPLLRGEVGDQGHRDTEDGREGRRVKLASS